MSAVSPGSESSKISPGPATDRPRRALITGITGQDGSYLAEFLLAKGYEVHGLVRRTSTLNTERIDHLLPREADGGSLSAAAHPARLQLHLGDLTDSNGLTRLVLQLEPDEIYNLAAQSHVRVSFDQPEYTAEVGGLGALRILEAARMLQQTRSVKVYQASTSEMFGRVTESPQNEHTRFHPRSPYGCAKVFAHHQTVNYREAYGLFACSGILFNHESPRRGEMFVTRKISLAAARIAAGRQQRLSLGNLDAQRDWGFAGDYVESMWLMLQQREATDFVIATGEMRSVAEFLELAFRRVGLDYRNHVDIDPQFFRPTEVEQLRGDASKARELLGWRPRTTFAQLVEMMVDADIRRIETSPKPA